VAAVLVLLLAGGGIAAAMALQPDDTSNGTAARDPATRSPRTATRTATETATVTATPSSEPSSSEAGPSSTGPAPASGPAQAVVDYYSLLPDDTLDAWSMLGPDARASAGGYGGYTGFWNSISSVDVGGTSVDGDVVSVQLTYDGSQSETRRLKVERRGDGWIIAEDLGT
jgi:hypothetical protein